MAYQATRLAVNSQPGAAAFGLERCSFCPFPRPFAHVRDKIRQQLQVLRHLGFVEFLGSGSYRLR